MQDRQLYLVHSTLSKAFEEIMLSGSLKNAVSRSCDPDTHWCDAEGIFFTPTYGDGISVPVYDDINIHMNGNKILSEHLFYANEGNSFRYHNGEKNKRGKCGCSLSFTNNSALTKGPCSLDSFATFMNSIVVDFDKCDGGPEVVVQANELHITPENVLYITINTANYNALSDAVKSKLIIDYSVEIKGVEYYRCNVKPKDTLDEIYDIINVNKLSKTMTLCNPTGKCITVALVGAVLGAIYNYAGKSRRPRRKSVKSKKIIRR